MNPLPEGIPFGGTYTRVEQLGQYLAELSAAIVMSPLHFTDTVGEGNVVSAIGVEENTLVKSTGKRYTMPCVLIDTRSSVSEVGPTNPRFQHLAQVAKGASPDRLLEFDPTECMGKDDVPCDIAYP